MKTLALPALILIALFLCSAATANAASPAIEEPAPNFTLNDAHGTKHSLTDYKGRYVVLEWVNFDCPFVHKHYSSGNMQKLQKDYAARGVVWLSVCSSAPGKQGYFEGKELLDRMALEKASASAYLLDPDGTAGRLYGAKTTPHMIVIDPKGTLIYTGGIDNIPSTDTDDIGRATNYVREALEASMAGKAVVVKSAKPYGCSVKYK